MTIRTALYSNAAKIKELQCVLDMDSALNDINFTAIGTHILDGKLALQEDEEGNLILGDGYNVKDGVATINIRGLLVPDLGYDLSGWGITGYDVIGAYVNHANETAEAENIESIKLDINSGGGFVRGIAGLIDILEASDLPINSYVSGHMCSAAYWVGCVGETIDAGASAGLVGSIGVRATHVNYEGALKKAGIEHTQFASGFWKGAFAQHKKLSKREKDAIQKDVDSEADDFFSFVSKNRLGLSKAQVKAFEGDTFSSKKALQLKLIDSIGDLKNELTDQGDTAMATEKDAKSTSEGTLTKAEAEAMADAAVKKALAKAEEDKQAALNRAALINDHASTASDVKKILLGAGFAGVKDEDLTALMDAIPSETFKEAMDKDGGAGVGGAPQEIEEDTDKEAETKRIEEANKAAGALNINI